MDILVKDGGQLNTDDTPTSVGPGNYTSKIDFRRRGDCEILREGYDYYKPNAGGDATAQRRAFSGAGASVDALFEARRANGEAVHIAVCYAHGSEGLKWFDYSLPGWRYIFANPAGVTFSFSVSTRWQILQLGSYVVFNNGIDLPFTWVIGDTTVTPIYELREQGVACVGDMSESNGMLILSDITQIKASALSTILGGLDPYGVVGSSSVERFPYQMTWSNFGDPRDFAATVKVAISSGSNTFSMPWAMRSFSVGDELTVLGVGAAGGNLVAKISSISGTTVTLSASASTSSGAGGASAQKTTALNSVVGYKDLDDDGTAILRQLRLGNRVVAYKSSGMILVGQYSGDLDNPWIYDTAYSPEAGAASRGLSWPDTLVSVADRYHLYAGDNQFYVFSLGYQEPRLHPHLSKCSRAMFFDRLSGSTSRRDAYASVNGCTEEVEITSRMASDGSKKKIAYHYTEGEESVAEIGGAAFNCGINMHAPNGLKSVDDSVVWFVMGGSDGLVTVSGRTNTSTIYALRYGESFSGTLAFAPNSLGDSIREKHLREWSPLLRSSPSGALSVSISGKSSQQAPTISLASAQIAATGAQALRLHFQQVYFIEQVSAQSGSGIEFSGRSLLFSQADGRSVTKVKA